MTKRFYVELYDYEEKELSTEELRDFIINELNNANIEAFVSDVYDPEDVKLTKTGKEPHA